MHLVHLPIHTYQCMLTCCTLFLCRHDNQSSLLSSFALIVRCCHLHCCSYLHYTPHVQYKESSATSCIVYAEYIEEQSHLQRTLAYFSRLTRAALLSATSMYLPWDRYGQMLVTNLQRHLSLLKTDDTRDRESAKLSGLGQPIQA